MSENDRFKPDYTAPDNNGDQNNPNNEDRNTPLKGPVNQNYINDAQQQQNNNNPNNDRASQAQSQFDQQINAIGNPYQQNFYQQKLANSEAVLVLGIISIVASICYGGGIIFGIIALVLANTANKVYEQNPSLYAPTSYNNLKAGKICAIIGVVISGLAILGVLIAVMMAFGIFSLALNSGI